MLTTNRKRYCQICGTTLNMYNISDRCHAHKPNQVILKAVPKVSCAAWCKKTPAHDGKGTNPNVHSIGGLMEPASDSFTEAAFSFHEVGRNNEAGILVKFGEEEDVCDEK